jgi:hypothetical protein
MRLRSLVATAIAAVGLAAAAAPSFATPVTFAQFSQTLPGASFTFTNNTTSGNDLKLTANVPVSFKFLVPNGYGPSSTPIAATLTMTGIVSPGVSGNAFTAGGFIFQPFSSITMTFTDIATSSNLLTVVTGTTGTLLGQPNGNSAVLNGDSGGGDTVTFTSDWLLFGATISRDFSLSFSGLNPVLKIQTAAANRHTGKLRTFTAAGTGTFASDPAPSNLVPEPSPALALLFGAAGLGLLFVRNRKIASARPLTA